MADLCPNFKYPVVKNRVFSDEAEWSEAVDLGVIGSDFSPKLCGFDLTEARQRAVEAGVIFSRCPECGRSLG